MIKVMAKEFMPITDLFDAFEQNTKARPFAYAARHTDIKKRFDFV